jgi:hypothetical protein
MPKTKMDYSNTIIYKIICKDPSIKEVYVGHTTNFVNRKSAHKTNSKINNSKLYCYIRAHGGWDNWEIIILDNIECKNYEEAKKAEQSYIDKYNCELNSSNAYSVKEAENNEITKKKENNEITKKKEIKNKEYKVATKYFCISCNYTCSNKFNFDKHLATLKHKKTEMIINDNELSILDNKSPATKFACLCGKEYKYIQGLYKHKTTCNYQDPVCVEIEKPVDASVDMLAMMMEQLNKKDKQMMELLEKKDEQMEQVIEQNKQQAELHKQQTELLTNTIKDMIPNMGNNNNSNNNTNNFNINMFLNEECKDAINMSDFIKSIQVSIDQLQYTTNNGLGKGLTKVIMDNMNKLSKYERPLHCSDLKRETIYIKDDDKWEKDTHKDKLKKAINKTSNKNYTALCDWTRENPAFMKQDDKQHFYAKTASTIGKPICDVEDKIITSICKDNFIKE